MECRPDDLTALIVKSFAGKTPGLKPAIEDLIVGCAQPAGESGYNIARAVSVVSGLPDVPGTTVNRYCASSLQAVRMAAHAIKAGEGDVFMACGVETVSRFKTGKADGMPDTKNPIFADAMARSAEVAEKGADARAPAEGLPDFYIPMDKPQRTWRFCGKCHPRRHGCSCGSQPKPSMLGKKVWLDSEIYTL